MDRFAFKVCFLVVTVFTFFWRGEIAVESMFDRFAYPTPPRNHPPSPQRKPGPPGSTGRIRGPPWWSAPWGPTTASYSSAPVPPHLRRATSWPSGRSPLWPPGASPTTTASTVRAGSASEGASLSLTPGSVIFFLFLVILTTFVFTACVTRSHESRVTRNRSLLLHSFQHWFVSRNFADHI